MRPFTPPIKRQNCFETQRAKTSSFSTRRSSCLLWPHFFLSPPPPLPFLLLLFSFFPSSFFSFSREHALSRAYVSRFACRVRGRGSRRSGGKGTDREKKMGGRRTPETEEGEGGRPTLVLLRAPTSPAPPLGTDFRTFKKRLHNRMYRLS